MSVVLLCANAAEAARYPGFTTALVDPPELLEGFPPRISAAFATPRARECEHYAPLAAICLAAVLRTVELTGTIPQVFMVGGEFPSELVRVA